ncbi:Hypothetical_protein [Hexamita inflata]|uniref:Hypothetical_protein n=1 Tax=Hexamita inflata TaxID=28002 RepID=A0AA86UMK4_9EUKA|nr:Hypothetical protein HINF_LOCUS44881 [Hexamita inflata]
MVGKIFTDWYLCIEKCSAVYQMGLCPPIPNSIIVNGEATQFSCKDWEAEKPFPEWATAVLVVVISLVLCVVGFIVGHLFGCYKMKKVREANAEVKTEQVIVQDTIQEPPVIATQ